MENLKKFRTFIVASIIILVTYIFSKEMGLKAIDYNVHIGLDTNSRK